MRPPAAGRQIRGAPPPRSSLRRVSAGRTGRRHQCQQAAGSRGEPYGGERRLRLPSVTVCGAWAVASPLLASPLLASVCRAPSWLRRSKPRPSEAWRALPTRQVEPAAGLGRRGAWRQPDGVGRSWLRHARARRGRIRPILRSRFDSSSKRDENRPKHKWKRLRGNAPKHTKPLDPGDKNRPTGCGARRRRSLPSLGGFHENTCFSAPMSASFPP